MIRAQADLAWLVEQRIGLQARPGLAERAGDRQFGCPRFQEIDHLGARTAQQFELQAGKHPSELPQHRLERLHPDGVRQRQRQRDQVAVAHGGRRRLGRDRRFVALAQHREHALTEFRQVRQSPLPPK